MKVSLYADAEAAGIEVTEAKKGVVELVVPDGTNYTLVRALAEHLFTDHDKDVNIRWRKPQARVVKLNVTRVPVYNPHQPSQKEAA